MSLGSQVLTAEIKKSVAESGEPRSEADDLNIALEILVCIYIYKYIYMYMRIQWRERALIFTDLIMPYIYI